MLTTTTTTRFAPSTMDALIGILYERRLALAHCVEGLRAEADDIVHTRDVSDLFDHQDPSGDVDLDLALALTRQAEDYLAEVEQALRRVDEGTYGFCTVCGHGIPIDRLRVLPATERCVACNSTRFR